MSLVFDFFFSSFPLFPLARLVARLVARCCESCSFSSRCVLQKSWFFLLLSVCTFSLVLSLIWTTEKTTRMQCCNKELLSKKKKEHDGSFFFFFGWDLISTPSTGVRSCSSFSSWLFFLFWFSCFQFFSVLLVFSLGWFVCLRNNAGVVTQTESL